MPEYAAEPPAPRVKWQRAAAGPPVADSDEPLRCGGPELSTEQRFLLMREKRLARQAEQSRLREVAEAKTAKSAPKVDDEDEDKAAERFRNDRYAVKLLQQDDSAWGGSASTGMIG